jgi:hypothetical protein
VHALTAVAANKKTRRGFPQRVFDFRIREEEYPSLADLAATYSSKP